VRHIGRLIVVGLALTGCGGARVVQAAQPVKGTVRYCAGESSERFDVKRFNRAHARQGLVVRLRVLAQPKRLAAAIKHGQCDVVELLGAQVAGYAAAGALRDLTAYVGRRRHEFLPATLHSGHYARRDWAVPLYENIALLYAHTYALPRTLQQLYLGGGLVYADGPDSALGFFETAYAAGGRVLTPDGRHSALDSPQNRAALALIRAAVVRGRATGGSARYAYREFLHGKARFMRNYGWYVATPALYQRRTLQVAPLPPFAGGRQASLMLDTELAVSRAARNLPAALAFIDARVSLAGVRPGARSGYLPPLASSYDDYERSNVLGGGYVMRALRHAVTLPVTPHFAEIGTIVAGAVSAAVTDRLTVAQALRRASRAIDQVLANDAPGGEA
jgi:multiple sugar transport system substrate-binding protein